MSNKKAKKLRKQTRKTIRKMSEDIYGQALQKLSKQRDVFAVVAVLEFLFICFLVVMEVLN